MGGEILPSPLLLILLPANSSEDDVRVQQMDSNALNSLPLNWG